MHWRRGQRRRRCCQHEYLNDAGVAIRSVWTHTFDAEGGVDIVIEVSVDPATPPLPRIGMRLLLSDKPEAVSWQTADRTRIILIAKCRPT